MAINFPASPTTNQTYTSGGKTWVWNGSVWATSTVGQVFSGSNSIPAAIFVNVVEDITVSATAASGTVAFDVTTQALLYYTTNATGNWTLNVRASSSTTLDTLLTNGQSITIVFAVTQGATAYYCSALQIDGTNVTPLWVGGSPVTAGNASGIDVYTYTIIKTATSTYTVLASMLQFK